MFWTASITPANCGHRTKNCFAMDEIYSAHGVQFRFPSFWEVSEESAGSELTITVCSPETSFWSLTLIRDKPRPEDVIKVGRRSLARRVRGARRIRFASQGLRARQRGDRPRVRLSRNAQQRIFAPFAPTISRRSFTTKAPIRSCADPPDLGVDLVEPDLRWR